MEQMEEESEQLSIGQSAFYRPVSVLDPCIAALPAGAESVQTFPHPLCCLRGDKSSRPKRPSTTQHRPKMAPAVAPAAYVYYLRLWLGLRSCYRRPGAEQSSGLTHPLLQEC